MNVIHTYILCMIIDKIEIIVQCRTNEVVIWVFNLILIIITYR